jgi:diguanylate cyclase (GGDEF)-like protein
MLRFSRQRALSLRASIYLLVVICLLPSVTFSTYLIWSDYLLRKTSVYFTSLLLARKVSADIDRELSAIESGLKILATSEHLASGNLAKFHEQASAAAKTQIIHNYVLIDGQGRQVLNTLRPVGSKLPEHGGPLALHKIFKEGTTVLTDLFPGLIVRKPVLAMGVPVRVDGQIRYGLNIGLHLEVLQQIIAREPLPEGWVLTVLDREATIIARSQTPELYVGKKAAADAVQRLLAKPEATFETQSMEGVPIVAAYHRSALWHWTVGIGVPRSTFQGDLVNRMIWLVLSAFGVLGLGLWLAIVLVNRVILSVRELNKAAQSISVGQAVRMPDLQFSEAKMVGDTLLQASQAMSVVQHRAHHDALTGLANRYLFAQVAQERLALAQRDQGHLAFIAIDLDNFKTVNDTQGHGVGDALLREVAARLRLNIRSSDLAARVGGDEFFVLAGVAGESVAIQFAERLIAALSVAYPEVTSEVSASVGIAIYPQAGASLEALMYAADQALNAAKRAGKARYVLSTTDDLLGRRGESG